MTKQENWAGLREFLYAGHYFELLATTNPVDVTLYGAADVVLARELQVSAGYFVDRKDGVRFERIEIDAGGVAQNVKFIVTDGQSGQRAAPTSISASVPATGIAFTQVKVTVNNASTPLRAANLSRKYLCVQNPSGAANSVFIRAEGGVAIADATAFELRPGQTWEPPVAPTGQINAIAAAGTDVNVIEG